MKRAVGFGGILHPQKTHQTIRIRLLYHSIMIGLWVVIILSLLMLPLCSIHLSIALILSLFIPPSNQLRLVLNKTIQACPSSRALLIYAKESAKIIQENYAKGIDTTKILVLVGDITTNQRRQMKTSHNGYDISTAAGQKDLFYGGRIDPNRPIGKTPIIKDSDREALKIHGESGLVKMGMYGIIDRLRSAGLIA